MTAPSQLARPLRTPADLDRLVERVGDAHHVLVGEASHGTHEYYRWRAEITRRLIEEKGFDLVAVEGDWPDCWAVNAWVRGFDAGDSRDAETVLGTFDRWPTWMWANCEVAQFITWLQGWNHDRPPRERVGFYGFDVYSLWESLGAILEYLTEHEPDALDAARTAMQCFDPYEGDPQAHAWATHMVDTLDRLADHHGPSGKAVVWAHNTHVGDARATDMAAAGYVNVGQLVRERHGDDDVVVIGFAGHRGSVIAGGAWGSRLRRLPVPVAQAGSLEDLFHREVGRDAVYVFPPGTDGWATRKIPHRAIGVVYSPEQEWGNYVPTTPARRYDAVVALEQTNALRPLGPEAPCRTSRPRPSRTASSRCARPPSIAGRRRR